MTISERAWDKFVADLRKISDAAASRFGAFLEQHPPVDQEAVNALIDYAFALCTRYGEAAGELACQMFDAVAAAEGVIVPAAAPAATATMEEVARAVVGTAKTGNSEIMSAAVGRLVKMAGVDTTLENAIRDGAEYAWIPRGETCAFCIALASRGWQPASKKAMQGGHAEHIHANCDCTYAIRFSERSTVSGYDPDRYREMYDDAPGRSSAARINSMRREIYAENAEEINAQKRINYARRRALESSEAEEAYIS